MNLAICPRRCRRLHTRLNFVCCTAMPTAGSSSMLDHYLLLSNYVLRLPLFSLLPRRLDVLFPRSTILINITLLLSHKMYLSSLDSVSQLLNKFDGLLLLAASLTLLVRDRSSIYYVTLTPGGRRLLLFDTLVGGWVS